MIESPVTADRHTGDVTVVHRRPVELCGLHRTVGPRGLHDFPYRILPVVATTFRRLGVERAGPAVTVLRAHDDGTFDVVAACPTARRLVLGRPFVQVRLPGGAAVQAVHDGPWETLLSTYDRLGEWLTAHRVPVPRLMWEEFLGGHDLGGDPAAWRTRVVVPLPPGR